MSFRHARRSVLVRLVPPIACPIRRFSFGFSVDRIVRNVS
jgi:hypothetical protein